MGLRPVQHQEASCRTSLGTAPTDPSPPNGCPPTTAVLPGEPLSWGGGVPALDDLEQLTRPSITEPGRPLLDPPTALTREQRLIERQHLHHPGPINTGVGERFAVGDHDVVDGVPARAQRLGDL